MKLDGKVALITGGTSGIGRAAAELFRDEGARVVAVGLDQDRLEQTRRELGPEVTALRADLRDVGEIDRLIRTVRESLGTLDVLFANAGKGTAAPLEAVTEEQVDEQFSVNFKGVFFTVQKAAPILAKGAASC
jgi:NAD(P)-dependent dehydrogenase (short-subunit alcohol dehydrogenase family)